MLSFCRSKKLNIKNWLRFVLIFPFLFPVSLYGQSKLYSPYLPDRDKLIEFESTIKAEKVKGGHIQVKVSALLASSQEELIWAEKEILKARESGAKLDFLVVGHKASDYQIDNAVATLEQIKNSGDGIKVEKGNFLDSSHGHLEASHMARLRLALVSTSISGTVVSLGVIASVNLPVAGALSVGLVAGIMSGTIQYNYTRYLKYIQPKWAERFNLFSDAPLFKKGFEFTESFIRQMTISTAYVFLLRTAVNLVDQFSDPLSLSTIAGGALRTAFRGLLAKFFYRLTIVEQTEKAIQRAEADGTIEKIKTIRTSSSRAGLILNIVFNFVEVLDIMGVHEARLILVGFGAVGLGVYAYQGNENIQARMKSFVKGVPRSCSHLFKPAAI